MEPFSAIRITISVIIIGLCQPTFAKPPQYEGKIVLFGNLHSHSNLSGDIKSSRKELSPSNAFKYADKHGIDFLAVSDHHKGIDANNKFRMSSSEYEDQLYKVAMSYNKKRKGEFIAIPAIEWGTIEVGNHINVFGAKHLPPDSILDKDYNKLIEWATSHADFAQYNHPYSWKNSAEGKKVGNFGRNLYKSTKDFSVAAEPIVKTMTIIATVYGGHISGENRHREDKTHRSMHKKAFSKYKKFLNDGFKLSPSANQDTHGENWGTVTAARTAVWADNFTYSGLMAGMKARRIYATEDDELALAAQVEVEGKRYWMGEAVPLTSNEQDIKLILNISQGIGSDEDTVNEGPYTATIYRDSNGIGGSRASASLVRTGIESGKDFVIPLTVSNGEYFFIEVTEENGKDNPIGDGEDEFNSAGEHLSDGKRDNLNDSAWSSPFWFSVEGKTGSYAWSKNSKLYHEKFCWAIDRIGKNNLRKGNLAPEGHTKHDCQT